MSVFTRCFPVGAELQPDGSTDFRVWAPRPKELTLVMVGEAGTLRDVRLQPELDHYFSARVPRAGAGARYYFRVDGELTADPASRFQPDGPFGPSQVVDSGAFVWTDQKWRGVSLQGQVVSEIHIGTFTPEGTWAAAAGKLPHLRDTGITVVEVMPVSEFPGRFGWGYDGAFPYAPTRLYGSPDDFRLFVDRAHALGVGVILDVVYNHLGPEGCVFSRLAREYFSTRYKGEWGDPLNFDGEGSAAVREFFVNNAAYWVGEFHLDGLRIDATQGIPDGSMEHVMAVIARRARAAAGGRSIVLVGENEPQHTRLVRPPSVGGYGFDALWNDDFHHSAMVAITGRREAYYSDHHGTAQEFVSAAKHGYLFQGQRYAWQRKPRGSSSRGIPRHAFVNFLENHDQVANSLDGRRLRLRTSPGLHRAATTLLLLMPGTPMLFQGQEFGATTPFRYFADLSPELADNVRKGRAAFVSQFPSLDSNDMRRRLPAPDAESTFAASRLDWSERDENGFVLRLHRDLLALRRTEAAFRGASDVDGAVLSPDAFVLRFFREDPAEERLIIVNFGRDLVAGSFAEPLVAPPEGRDWRVQWSSEHPDYGGSGAPAPVGPDGWCVAGHSAFVLEPMHDRSRSTV